MSKPIKALSSFMHTVGCVLLKKNYFMSFYHLRHLSVSKLGVEIMHVFTNKSFFTILNNICAIEVDEQTLRSFK